MKKPTTYAHWCLTCDSGGEVTEPSEAARIALAHQRATLHENGEFRIPHEVTYGAKETVERRVRIWREVKQK